MLNCLLSLLCLQWLRWNFHKIPCALFSPFWKYNCACVYVRVGICVCMPGARHHGLAVFYSACVSSMLVMLLETQLCWNNNQDPLQHHQPPSGRAACICVGVCVSFPLCVFFSNGRTGVICASTFFFFPFTPLPLWQTAGFAELHRGTSRSMHALEFTSKSIGMREDATSYPQVLCHYPSSSCIQIKAEQ